MFDKVKKVFDSLPIGYYAKRKIDTELVENGTESFYDHEKDKITIGGASIMNILSEMEDVSEEVIRSLLYHEVSHVILTPKYLYSASEPSDVYYDMDKWQHIMNVFCDERIETLLNNFYIDVNFKELVFKMNGLKNGDAIPQPKSQFEAFYMLVRFRIGDAKLLEEVNKIIYDFADINKDSYDNDYYRLREYGQRVWKLFEKLSNYPDNPSDYRNPLPQFSLDGDSKDGDGDADGEETEASPKDEDANSKGGKCRIDISDATKEMEANLEKLGKKAGFSEAIKNGLTNKYDDNELVQRLQEIITRFNKKNKDGSSISSYSGVVNPRNLVTRNDYRIFDRSFASRSNNKFGNLHLNLFVDDSGSFSYNQDRANTLIKALSVIEKRNPNFSYSIVHCGATWKETTKGNEFIHACGGTYADFKVTEKIFKNLQKKDCYNYNIIMYDGDVWCKNYRDDRGVFEHFDNSNSTIIYEAENMYQVKLCNRANKIFIKGNEYVERLTDEVCNALAKAFR